MELCSLHLLDLAAVRAYVVALETGDNAAVDLPAVPWTAHMLAEARQGYGRARTGSEAGANAVSYGLALLLATKGLTFVLPGLG